MSIIAISRGTFSGGEALATAVAARTGYRCVSREVILEAAWRYKIPENELTAAMEKRPPLLERMAGVRKEHLVFVRAALAKYAKDGDLIYHGYLGHLLLPNVTHVIRVRVIADMDYRIAAAIERNPGFSRKDAIAYIEKMDKARRQWTRFLFDVDWNDPSLYDVVLNLSRMSLATACKTVIQLTEREEFRPTPASLKAVDDLAVGGMVGAALATDPLTRGADLEVVADGGAVTITGTTQSPAIVEGVAGIAKRVPGVKEVRSQVRYLLEGKTP
ncbi:MAG: cytidylate kinase family protein [Candidatus Methylomirabilales bacterium]